MHKIQQESSFSGFRDSIDRIRPCRLSDALRSFRDVASGGQSAASSPKAIASTCTRNEPESQPDTWDDRPPFDEERRRFLRRRSKGTVRLIPRTDIPVSDDELPSALQTTPYRGRMQDLSMSGVAFVLDEPLSERATVWLRLESERRDFAVIRPAIVIRVIPTDEGQSKIMCRFDHFLPQGDVRQLGHDIC